MAETPLNHNPRMGCRRLAAVIPGAISREQLEQNGKASYTPAQPFSEAGRRASRECAESCREQLQASYAGYGWLRDWKLV